MNRTNSKIKAPAVKLPDAGILREPDIHVMKNGIPVYLFPSGSTEIVRLILTFNAGTINESQPLQARFTNVMLQGGTARMSAKEIDEEFDFHGSFPNFSVERDIAVVQLFMLPADFSVTARLLDHIVAEPLFPGQELKMHQETRLQSFMINRQKVSTISLESLLEMLFGSDHPYGRRIQPEYFAAVTRESLNCFHNSFYRNGLKRIALAGKITDKEIDVIEELFGGRPKSSSENNLPLLPETDYAGRKLFIEKKDALQSSLRIAGKTVNMAHPDFQGMKIVDTILGGWFGSRLMRNLREDKGYTYGIGSSLHSYKLGGLALISTETGAPNTRAALTEIYREMDALQTTPVSRSELRLVRNSMLGEMVRQFDGPFSTCDSFMTALDAGLGMDYYNSLQEKIRSVTANEIKQLAETYYSKENFCEIVAGRME
ncbi:MAG: pitrilysin family protein [Bacteroidales bacterium]